MISTDRLIFDEKSAVRARQVEYAKEWEEVHIVVFEKPTQDTRRIEIAPNCWVYLTQSYSKFLYPWDAIRLGKKIIQERAITDITCQDASLTALAGVCLKKKFGIPLEIQIHEDLGSPYYAYNVTNKIRKMLANRYIPQAEKIRVVSERIKKYVEMVCGNPQESSSATPSEERGTHPQIEVRPIAVDMEIIKAAPVLVDLHRKYRQFDKIVLMASRLEKEKNIELAIKAWPEVIKNIPKAGLLIVGSGSQKSHLLALTSYLLPPSSKLSLDHSIIFEDWVDRQTLISYYKTADLFLNTSLFEGYGMTLVEAQAAGCKIVSTDVGVAREAGAMIVYRNTADISRCIIESLRSP